MARVTMGDMRYLEKSFSVAPGTEPAYLEQYDSVFGPDAGPQFLPCGHRLAWYDAASKTCGACGEAVCGIRTQGEDE